MNRSKQNGTALLVSLLVLITLTLVAVNAMNSSILQEKMAAGSRSVAQSVVAAESAVREGERFLWDYQLTSNGAKPLGSPTGIGGIYSSEAEATDIQTFRNYQGWDGSLGSELAMIDYTSTANNQLSENPVYVISEVPQNSGPSETRMCEQSGGSCGQLVMYRVSARATGMTDSVVRLTESIFQISQ
ncbi:MAG: pilus assembly PilX family protein [bacterium]